MGGVTKAGTATVTALGLAGLLALAGCASDDAIGLRPLPAREADLYPIAQSRGAVTVAIDTLASPARTEQHFGIDLRDAGILPIQVIVSNHGPRRLVVGPDDVLLVRDRAVIDPLPLESVIRTVKERAGFRARDREIDAFFVNSAFHETGIAPGATVRGMLYFPVPPVERARDRYWSVSRMLYPQELKLRVAVTDADTNDRVRFGPLPVILSPPPP